MLKPESRLIGAENEKINKKKFFLLYTALFALVSLFVFFRYIDKGLTFVRMGDGYWQHLNALEYYGKWLRSIVYNLFSEHKLIIPSWDFSIGLGSDVVTTLNYYAIGDPLALLSIIVPVKYTVYLFNFLSLLRLYLSGFFFSLFCFERKHKNSTGVMVSAFVYIFGSYALSAATKHTFLINAMIYLPILLICVERIFKNKNPIYLAFIVCIAEISNFYLFYVLVITTVIYVVVRLFEIYKTDIKSMLAPLFRIAISSVIGVLLGAIIFIPIVCRLFSDGRMSIDTSYPLLYPLAYYLKLPGALVTYSYCGASTFFGYSVMILFALVALFSLKKKNFSAKLFLIICACGFATPLFASVANGFSYPTNRWLFVFTMVLAFILSDVWEDIFKAEKKATLIIALVPVAYVIFCFLFGITAKKNMLLSAVFILIISSALIINRFVKTEKFNIGKLAYAATAVVSILSIIVNSQFAFADLSKYYSVNLIRTSVSDDVTAVNAQSKLDGESGFYRYTGDYLTVNDNVRRGVSNTQHYWSFSNGAVSDFQLAVNLNEPYFQWVNGFDEITTFNTLSSVKYFYDAENKNATIPYGYEKTETDNVYVNTNFLPLGYTYSGYITREDFDSLPTSLDKQQAMLQGAIVQEAPELCEGAEPRYVTKEVKKKMIIKNEDVTYSDKTFVVTKEDATVYFAVEPQKMSEFYISFKDISYKGVPEYSLYTDDANCDPNNLYDMEDFEALDSTEQERILSESKYFAEEDEIALKIGMYNGNKELVNAKKVEYFTPNFDFYCGKTNFDANLGYSEDGYSYIAIRFPYIGEYSFGDISFYSQTMDIYSEGIKELSAETLQNIKIGANTVTGDITVTGNKLLCLSIPHSRGWSAFVDGEEAELFKANVMYMGLELSEGEHHIELRYRTPDMKNGTIITIFGLVLLFSYGMWYHIRKKKNLVEIKEID